MWKTCFEWREWHTSLVYMSPNVILFTVKSCELEHWLGGRTADTLTFYVLATNWYVSVRQIISYFDQNITHLFRGNFEWHLMFVCPNLFARFDDKFAIDSDLILTAYSFSISNLIFWGMIFFIQYFLLNYTMTRCKLIAVFCARMRNYVIHSLVYKIISQGSFLCSTAYVPSKKK